MKKHLWTLQDRTLSRIYDPWPARLLGGVGVVLGFPMSMLLGAESAWLGGALLLAGLALLFYRSGIVLDGPSHTWTSWWGLLGPWRRSVRSVAGARVVEITRDTFTLHGGRGPEAVYERHAVTLRASPKPMLIERFVEDPDEARWTAESVSRVLGVAYRDATVTPTIEKKSKDLDESLGDRYVRTGKPVPQPRKPARCRATYDEMPDRLEIHIPRARLADPWIQVGLMLATTVAATGVLVLFKQVSWQVAAPLSLVVSVLGYAKPFWEAWKADRLVETVCLTPRSLQVDSTAYGRQGMPLEQLEEMFLRRATAERQLWTNQVEQYFRAGVVCARSDDGRVRFGGGLDSEELVFVQDLLLEKIVAFARRSGTR